MTKAFDKPVFLFGGQSVDVRKLIGSAKVAPYEDVKRNLDIAARKTRRALFRAVNGKNGRREA